MSKSDVVPSSLGERGEPTPQRPVYSKFTHDPCAHVEASASATTVWGIQVNEGWRSWILCSGMYEWAADDLLARLRETNREWLHGEEPQPHEQESRDCC
jgi:hypothetical protein